jgi:hypothetical protein
MAQFVFKFTQATNYDTSSFRSSDSYNRKQTRSRQARQTNIISSIDEMFSKTILGPLVDYLGKGIASVGAIIKTEQPEFNIVTDELLAPYAEAESYNVSDDDFAKIASKAKVGLVDFVAQVKSGLNTQLYKLMVDDEKSVAAQLEAALVKYPNIQLLHDLQVDSSDRVGGAKTIKLKVNEKSAPAENMYQGMMRELRDNPDTNQLYKGLVDVAIIQGAYQSPVSIINIIPIEDYSAIVKPIIDSLVSDQDVKAYGEQFLFQKNNFADDTIVPQVIVNFEETPGVEPIEFGEDLVYYYMSDNFPSQLGLGPNKILLLDPRYNRDELEYDVVKMKRLIEQDGDTIDVFTGTSVVSAMYAIRKAQGDLSLRDVIGYQKVRYTNGDPVLDFDEKGVGRHVYKMINLLGDGSRASEYYLDARRSVFNNGTVKVENEISDKVVRDYYEALNLEFRETEEYTPFEELFVEQPQLPAAEQPTAEIEVINETTNRLNDLQQQLELAQAKLEGFEFSPEGIFYNFFKSGARIKPDSFDRLLDRNKRSASTNGAYIDKNGMPYDNLARAAYEASGIQIDDEQAVVNLEQFISNYSDNWKTPYNNISNEINDILKEIDSISAGNEVAVTKRRNTNNKIISQQLSLFDENKPEGLPAIDRTNETCN